jgi:hypothetical protein
MPTCWRWLSCLASHLLIIFKSEIFCEEIVHMALNPSQFGTNGSRWARWCLFLLLVLAGNVVVATLAWIIVGLVTR